jgi:Ribbon-helix-helix protein, copG family
MTKIVRLRAPDRRNWQRQYRLSKLRWHYQIIRLDHDDAEALRALAKRDGTTVAELIRTYVAWGLENDYEGADRD